MKFGVREVANVVFKAREKQKIGSLTFNPGQPVLYIDTAKISTIDQNATTFYAVGGLNHARLLGWQGQKQLTFTVENAVLSPISVNLLSKASQKQEQAETTVSFHQTTRDLMVSEYGVIDLSDYLNQNEEIDPMSPLFIISLDRYWDITSQALSYFEVSSVTDKNKGTIKGKTLEYTGDEAESPLNAMVIVDYYIKKSSQNVTQFQILANDLSTYYYYVQAQTLFRRQHDGVDIPTSITFPNVKIQPNFSLPFHPSGQPATFSFVMDAFPAYTFFNRDRKFLCLFEMLEGYLTSTIIVKNTVSLDENTGILTIRPDSVYNKNADEKILWLVEDVYEVF